MRDYRRWLFFNFIFAFSPVFINYIYSLWSPKNITAFSFFEHGEFLIISAVISIELIGKLVYSQKGVNEAKALLVFSCLLVFMISSISYSKVLEGNANDHALILILTSVSVVSLIFLFGIITHYVIRGVGNES